MDQQLARGVTPDTAINTQTQGNRTVTLEVLPEAAERVAVAVRLGKLALSVRATDMKDTAGESPAASSSVVSGSVSSLVRPVGQALAPGAQAGAGPASATQAAPAAPVASRAPATTWGADVSPALGQRSGPAAATPKVSSTVRVFQGSGGEKEFKFE